ncbi:MAG: vitamin B12 dependent-methionine synthase activation domain-containing protein [Candidatus Margulisiibacteriota bacterium]
MAKTRHINLAQVYPFINKTTLFKVSWGMLRRKQNQKEISQKLNSIFEYLKTYFIQTGIKGIVYYDEFTVDVADDTLHFRDQSVSWRFPRLNHRCIADSAKDSSRVALQVVSLGKAMTHLYEQYEKEDLYSMLFYVHGFSVFLTEALAEYHHNLIHAEWDSRNAKERYSFGYPLCPELSMQKDLFALLKIKPGDEVSLTTGYMM